MKRVAILLSTYNGSRFLREQLDSLLKQEGVDICIYARDDGSSDGTQEILEEYRKRGVLEWYQGMNLKPALSFKELMKKAPAADYYAFCDQDDYWLPEKLIRAITKLEGRNESEPCLYCGKPNPVNERLEPIQKGTKRQAIHADSFAARLVVRNAIGCTMVFNRKLLDEVNKSDPNYLEMHDIWTYEVCNVLDGYIYYDDSVPILYRQHANNTVGANIHFGKRWINRIKRFCKKDCQKSMTTRELYQIYQSTLNQEKRTDMELLLNYRRSLYGRLRVIKSDRYRTDSARMNRNFKIAIFLRIF